MLESGSAGADPVFVGGRIGKGAGFAVLSFDLEALSTGETVSALSIGECNINFA
jgi:hypothetical protein